MKIVAYGRLTGTALPVADQIARAEAWAQRRRHQPLRLVGHELRPGADEYPARSDLLEACEGGQIEGVVVTDVAALGPRLAQTLARLDRSGARLLVAGDTAGAGHDLDTQGLNLMIAVARAAVEGAEERRARPRRVCPPRVKIDMDAVRAAQERGLRIIDISQELGIARSTLVARLRRARELSGGGER